MTKVKALAIQDLSAAIEQNAVDKLLDSTGYPLRAFTHDEDFHPLVVSATGDPISSCQYVYTEPEGTQLLADAAGYASGRPSDTAAPAQDDHASKLRAAVL